VTLLGGPTQSDSFKGKSYETSVPTNVHLDLERAGVISNPLLENNYPKVKWVSECNFSYSTNFTISNDNLKYPLHKLTFEGIDTHSEVFLNDKLILTTANAFRRYSTYVQGILK
jgi:beta-mannosidase